MKLRLVTIFAATLVVYGLLVGYIGWNGWVFLSSLFGLEHAGIYAAAVAFIALSYLLGRAGQSASAFGVGRIAELFKLIGSYWFAVLEYAIIMLPVANIAALILNAMGVSSRQYVAVIGIAVVILLLVLLLRGTWNAWTPAVRTYHLSVAKRAGARKKLRIAVASDIHLGTIVGSRHLERLAKEIEKMRPDLILLPGDIIDDDIGPYLKKEMSRQMGRLKAPLGVYAVLGNHEYIGGHIPRFLEEMKAVGIDVLLDESRLVDGSFYVIGRKDLTAERHPEGRRKVEELVEGLNMDLPLIIMDHQPSDLNAFAESGIDISVSGHTHRGQFAPNHWITRRLFELDHGYMHKGGLHAVVSSGFGTWGPPVRIASRSEIVRLEVDFEPEDL